MFQGYACIGQYNIHGREAKYNKSCGDNVPTDGFHQRTLLFKRE